MAMTMTQKILAAHAGLPQVKAGDLIEAKLDLVLGNDITTPVAITAFDRAGFTRVFDREKIAIVLDHSTPCKDIKSAQLCHEAREFAKRFSIKNFFDVGEVGIEHALLPEKGLVAPGELVIGADSHTCTYGALGAFSTGVGSTDMAAGMAMGENWFKVPEAIRVELTGALRGYASGKDVILHLIGMIGVDGALYQSLEFTGPGVASLSMDDRFTIANMAIEAGAKNGIFPVDEKTRAYMKGRTDRPWQTFDADPDAEYARTVTIDLSTLEPTVSLPHLPSNTRRISEVKGMPIQQAVIGSCTNGRIEDLRAAMWPPACAASSSRQRRPFISRRCMRAWLIRLSPRAALFRRRPAAPAWAGIWALCAPESELFPRRTAILSAAWATPAVRSFWPAPPSRRRPLSQAAWQIRRNSGKESEHGKRYGFSLRR